MNAKQWWLDLAEVICALQIFPRLLLLLAFASASLYAWYAPQLAVAVVRETPSPGLAEGIISGVIAATVPFVGQIFTQVLKLNRTGYEERP
ncbi:hypothetical protein [Candidatus Macondimonas diazotrophica]|uniref:Uncharacterized protein n=1 Tax=Candidatus Macondimonas diazotrophica TaxID=2305248 RepID=A0A4Z0F4X9_9GAMM|nr:hypothetical protein [Candidatus Macondimonas diazotrophica]TFZ81340.1 hypothetical protein E4680_12840 [Candidatus Macondimonas diazotrophica]